MGTDLVLPPRRELVLAKTLYDPGLVQPKVFVSGRCDWCRTWFTSWTPMAKAIRKAARPAGSPGRNQFCSTVCQIKSRNGRRQPLDTTFRLSLSRRCARPACGAWFTTRWTIKQVARAFHSGQWPVFCTPRCRQVASAPPLPAPLKRRRMCPACWVRPVATSQFQQVVCEYCMTIVEASCRGKARRGTERNAGRIAAARGSWNGKDLSTYECELCGWWHVGRRVGRARAKQVSFVVQLFSDRCPPGRLEEIRREYAPDRRNAKGPRVRLARA